MKRIGATINDAQSNKEQMEDIHCPKCFHRRMWKERNGNGMPAYRYKCSKCGHEIRWER